MKKIKTMALRAGSKIAFIVSLLLFAACTNRETVSEDNTYTCPMHPTVVSDRPGSCPVCGMDLVRKTNPANDFKITQDLSNLMKSPNEFVVSDIRTIQPDFKSMSASVEAVGVVTYDPRNIFSVAARVGGRIEKMYVKYRFQKIKKGQRLAEIYSPELATAERELLYLLENDPDNEVLVSGAKRKLQLLGLTETQIDNIIAHKALENTFVIYSPYDGYVITDDVAPASSSGTSLSNATAGNAMNEMGASSTGASKQETMTNESASSAILREGDYLSTGQVLVKIVDPKALRIELDIASGDAGAVKVGDKVAVSFENGKEESTTVDFIQPFYSDGQTFLKIRVYTNKTSDLQIGQFVKGMISMKPKESLWVPREAVLDLGHDQVVFIKHGEILKPKKIVTGVKTGNQVEVTAGLVSSDEIAANAQYLVDSESFIKVLD